MQLRAPGVRIVDAETCDFSLMPSYETADLLSRVMPGRGHRYLESSSARALVQELGVRRRHLTAVPGQPLAGEPLNAFDLAVSAVRRLQSRQAEALLALDALIFVSTSNPNPCNSQASLLAERLRLEASCMDLKAGCSGGVLGILQAALLIRAGCHRVLVVMAENLSRLVPPDDLRALLTVGDGAACVLVERGRGPGFLAMIHGSEPALASAMTLTTPFPPARPDARYVFEFQRIGEAVEHQRRTWRSVFRETLDVAGLVPHDLEHVLLHQTHAGQVRGLVSDLGLTADRVPCVVADYGNVGTPTVAIALTRVIHQLEAGQRYLLEAVGGGVSWCAIAAEHG